MVMTLAPTLTWAHEGHGIAGPSHWHASDLLLFAAAAVAAVVMLVLRGRK
jgi:hypothetical protein